MFKLGWKCSRKKKINFYGGKKMFHPTNKIYFLGFHPLTDPPFFFLPSPL